MLLDAPHEAEAEWLDAIRAAARTAGIDLASAESVERVLDEGLDAWTAAPPDERFDPSSLLHMLGCALGDLLVARMPGSRWAVSPQADGTHLVVTTAEGERVVHPFATVVAGWNSGTHGWFARFVEETATGTWSVLTADALAPDAAATSHRPSGRAGAPAHPDASSGTSGPSGTSAASGTPGAVGDELAGHAAPSTALREIAAAALEQAMREVVPAGGPLIPFVLADTPDGRTLTRFPEDLEHGQPGARAHVRALPGVVRAAVAWDGYLTVDDDRHDALFVEASERGDPASILVAHRYRDAGAEPAQAVGRPLVVERRAPLF